MRPVDNASNHEIDFDHLRARVREKPRTKAGQVRQAWPEIKDLISAGHSLKDIWAWLNESGVSIGYARLSHYVGQLRKQERLGLSPVGRGDHPPPDVAQSAGASRPDTAVTGAPVPLPARMPDPLANVRDRLENRPGFNYNSQPDLKKLI